MRAHQIMTRQVITTTVNTPIIQAARTLLAHHISGMPVVDATGKLVGVVSQGDFMRRAEIGTQRKRSRMGSCFHECCAMRQRALSNAKGVLISLLV